MHGVHAVTVPVAEYVPASHALFVVAPAPPPDAGHAEPPGHAEHVALAATPAASKRPAVHGLHAVTVPVAEYVPASHALFVVAPAPPPDAGHSEPPGHAEHAALVATPAGS